MWDFDPYMTIFEASLDGSGLKRLTDTKGYNAEGSYSTDGKQIVFCSNRTGEKNLELFIMDADGKNVRQLTHAPGCYNGGPFFSPDGKRVIFRSDRKKQDHLQLFVINSDGTGERALTDDLNWVHWAPFWYKDSKHIVYTAADHSNPTQRPNYDLYWMNVETGEKTRLTFAPGADVLPVFNRDCTKLMWTSTRDGQSPAQLYLADFRASKNHSESFCHNILTHRCEAHGNGPTASFCAKSVTARCSRPTGKTGLLEPALAWSTNKNVSYLIVNK